MQNAHLRLGRLEYRRNTEMTSTRIFLHVDRYMGEGRQAHLLSLFGNDAEVGARFASRRREARQEGILDVKPAVGIRKGFEETTCGSSRRISLRDGLFGSAEDLALRIPLLNRKELTLLACKTAHWKCARMTSTNPGSRNGYSEDLNSACRRHTCCGPESS